MNNREDLFKSFAARIRRLNSDAVTALRVEVDRCRRSQFIADDGERGVVRVASAGYQRIGERVGGIHVGGGEGSNHGSRDRIIRNRIIAQSDRGGSFIDVVNIDGKVLVE